MRSSQGRSAGTLTDVPLQSFLTMVVGSDIDRQYPLAGIVSIGRDTDNDILVSDLRVSRRHAQIRADGGRVTIVDVGSTNGTYLNEVPITGERVLRDGDLIRMGRTEWTFNSSVQIVRPRPMPRRPVDAVIEPARSRNTVTSVPSAAESIVEHDELPWNAIAIVSVGLFIALSICCVAALFIASR